jgi:hypothetical protein
VKTNEEEVEVQRDSSSIPKTQMFLSKKLREVLNWTVEEDIQFNAKHPYLSYSNTNFPIELDIYIPSLNIAFEYQGEYHFYSPHHQSGSPSNIQKRDKEKLDKCNANNITLITIPYWWDRTCDSLKATIHRYRCDLIPQPGTGNQNFNHHHQHPIRCSHST